MGFPVAIAGLVGVRGRTQWLHCAFGSAAPATVSLEEDMVVLAAVTDAPSTSAANTALRRRGMAIDRHGRLYRADPAGRAIEVILLGEARALSMTAAPVPVALPDASNGPKAPCALAVTMDDHLFVLGEDEAKVFVYDLHAARYVGVHPLARNPVDIVFARGLVHVLLEPPSAWVALSLCQRPRPLSWPAGLDNASRLAFSPCGEAFALIDAGKETARIVGLGHPRRSIETDRSIPTPGGRELTILRGRSGVELVAAGEAHRPIIRLLLTEEAATALSPFEGRNYDGGGIVRTVANRVMFHGRQADRDLGVLTAAPARRRFTPEGEVILFRLDAKRPANRWGRVFLDACLPDGTDLRLLVRTSDDPDDDQETAHIPPANLPVPPVLFGAGASVRPSATSIADPGAWNGAGIVKARESDGSDRFALYEAPVPAPPGRYLWMRLILTGRGSSTPRLRRVLVEKRGHDWQKHLPRALARRSFESESFLHRFLTPTAGLLSNAEAASNDRHELFDPARTPVDALPWLGEMLGFPIESDWPESVTRAMLMEANSLLRMRGTPAGLMRMLEILTGHRISIIESFRLRAGGGIGGGQARTSTAVIGAGFRVGGNADRATLVAGATDEDDAIRAAAHRFTVLIQGRLTPDVERSVSRLLERHRPAHTLVNFCTVDSGMRVSIGNHVGLTSIIGPTSGFEPAVVGSTLLGKGTLLGTPGIANSVFRGDEA